MMRVNRAVWMTGIMAVVLTMAVTESRASFIPTLKGVSDGGNGLYSYDYELTFTTSPGTESLNTGDFVTIYDFSGYAGVVLRDPTEGTASPANFSAASALLGVNGPTTNPPDSASITNLTLTYRGSTITTNTTFSGFSILSTNGPDSTPGYFTGQTTKTADGTSKLGFIGETVVPSANGGGDIPSTPEPSSIVLTGLGVVGALGVIRRRRLNVA